MTEQQPGRFITLEGTEGVGKSTMVPVLVDALRSRGLEVVQTREPGSTPLGERLRSILLNGTDPIDADAELLLMFASRAQLIADVIRPALMRGAWVVCDRFSDATFAYQGAGRGVDFVRIEIVAQWVLRDLQPDLTILLDADADTRNARTKKRGALDRIESESDDFFERVRAGYLRRADMHPDRFEVIDANPEFRLVRQRVQRVLEQKIEHWLGLATEC